jgi:hypothetical protein
MTTHAELGSSGHLEPEDNESGRRRRQGRLPPQAPGTRRCMVLACTDEDTTAVDLHSGALVRLRIEWDGDTGPTLSPLQVVDAVWAEDPERDDLAQPEAVTVTGGP